MPYLLSLLGFGLAGVTGWLGGEMVDRLGVGVDDGANWTRLRRFPGSRQKQDNGA